MKTGTRIAIGVVALLVIAGFVAAMVLMYGKSNAPDSPPVPAAAQGEPRADRQLQPPPPPTQHAPDYHSYAPAAAPPPDQAQAVASGPPVRSSSSPSTSPSTSPLTSPPSAAAAAAGSAGSADLDAPPAESRRRRSASAPADREAPTGYAAGEVVQASLDEPRGAVVVLLRMPDDSSDGDERDPADDGSLAGEPLGASVGATHVAVADARTGAWLIGPEFIGRSGPSDQPAVASGPWVVHRWGALDVRSPAEGPLERGDSLELPDGGDARVSALLHVEAAPGEAGAPAEGAEELWAVMEDGRAACVSRGREAELEPVGCSDPLAGALPRYVVLHNRQTGSARSYHRIHCGARWYLANDTVLGTDAGGGGEPAAAVLTRNRAWVTAAPSAERPGSLVLHMFDSWLRRRRPKSDDSGPVSDGGTTPVEVLTPDDSREVVLPAAAAAGRRFGPGSITAVRWGEAGAAFALRDGPGVLVVLAEARPGRGEDDAGDLAVVRVHRVSVGAGLVDARLVRAEPAPGAGAAGAPEVELTIVTTEVTAGGGGGGGPRARVRVARTVGVA